MDDKVMELSKEVKKLVDGCWANYADGCFDIMSKDVTIDDSRITIDVMYNCISLHRRFYTRNENSCVAAYIEFYKWTNEEDKNVTMNKVRKGLEYLLSL